MSRAVDDDSQAPLWLFGYGSLIWRPGFDYEARVPGAISGWVRRFWQGSTDHRGVPGAPGRVVTLVPEAGGECWGLAYRVARAEQAEVLARLDHREKGGYERHTLTVTTRESGRTLSALVYVATRDNPNYLGPAPMGELAAQVRLSRGPSGHNLDYVFRLEQALGELGVDDEHVSDLARALREHS